MKASELIAQLQNHIEEHGDLTCYSFFEVDRKGNGYYVPLHFTDILESVELNAGDYLVVGRNEKGIRIS